MNNFIIITYPICYPITYVINIKWAFVSHLVHSGILQNKEVVLAHGTVQEGLVCAPAYSVSDCSLGRHESCNRGQLIQ